MVIRNNYDVSNLGSQKWFHIVRTNLMGGDNIYLGILFIITGSLSALVAVIYLSKHLYEKYKIYKQK